MLSFHGYQRSRHMAGETAAIIAAEERADRAVSKLEKIKAKSDAMTHAVIHKGITAGVAGGLGYWQGYKGEMPEMLGVGADLWIGGLASLAALFGDELGIGDYSTYLDAVGTGALAFWAANQGNMYGVAKAEKETPDMYPGEQKGGFPTKPTTAGYGDGVPSEFAPQVPNHGRYAVAPDGVPYGYGR